MRHVVYLALVLFSLGSIQPAPQTHALTGRQVLNTEPFVCTGKTSDITWTNDTGTSLHIRKAQIWMGMDYGGRSDFWFWLHQDGNTVAHTNWDHYAEPTRPHNLMYTFAPDFILVPAGDTLTLRYGCSDFDDTTHHGHVTVTLWWY